MSKRVTLITSALTSVDRTNALAFAMNSSNLTVGGRRPTDGKAVVTGLIVITDDGKSAAYSDRRALLGMRARAE